MICRKCGKEIHDTSNYCIFCGARQNLFEDLVCKAMEGDNDSISELYARTIEKVYFAVKLIVKDDFTAETIVQDAYVKGFKNLYQLKDATSFQAWIKKIARNKAIDWIRSQKITYVEQFTYAEEIEIQEKMEERIEYLPEDFIDQKETQRLLKKILDALPDDQRTIICMYYYNQMSQKEIAAELNLNLNTVKSRMNYAYQKIRYQVLELEKQGTKLRTLAPVPFFVALLHTAEKTATEIPSAAVFQAIKSATVKSVATAGTTAILSESGKELSRQVSDETVRSATKKAVHKTIKHTGKTMAYKATKTGVGTLAKGTILKGAAATLTVTLTIAGGSAAGIKLSERYIQKQQNVSSPNLEEKALPVVTVTPSPTPTLSPEEQVAQKKKQAFELYEDTLNLLVTALSEHWNYQQFSEAGFPGDLQDIDESDFDSISYAIEDLDKNGTYELAIFKIYPDDYSWHNYNVYLMSLFTLEDNKVVPIIHYAYRSSVWLLDNGYLLEISSGSAVVTSHNIYYLKDSELVNVKEVVYEGYLQDELGTESPWFYTDNPEYINLDSSSDAFKNSHINISDEQATKIINNYSNPDLECIPLFTLMEKREH